MKPKRRVFKALDIENTTILHLAVGHDAVRVVEALWVEHGMDINVKDGCAYTPLDVGAMSGHVAVVRFFLRKQRELEGLSRR